MRQPFFTHQLRNATVTVLMTLSLCVGIALAGDGAQTPATAPAEHYFAAPYGMKVAVKMIGPVTQTTDLQIICILRHSPTGDKYIEAMGDLNDKLGGMLSSLRDRNEFAGDLGETLLITPPLGTIAPRQLLLIGIGDETALSLDQLRLVGRIAIREAVRLHAAHVSFAPVLRDQGSKRIDVADGDAAFASQLLLAYDTEKRLQDQGITPKWDVEDVTIEAGPTYFDAVVIKVDAAIHGVAGQLKERIADPYRRKLP